MFSRATWVLSYYNGNTSAWIRQNVEIRSLDTTWFVTTSAPTQGWHLYGINDISPQLPMAPQSYYRRWKVDVICKSYAQATVAGSWTNRFTNPQKWPSSKEDYAERLVWSKRNYSLGTSSTWLYHHCWFLLSTIGLSCGKTPGEAGQNLFLTWQRQTSHCKVNA